MSALILDIFVIFTLSADLFASSLACSAGGIRIPRRAALAMSGTGALFLLASLLLRERLAGALSPEVLSSAGFYTLFFLGIWELLDPLRRRISRLFLDAFGRRSRRGRPPHPLLSRFAALCADACAADADRSRELSVTEAILLALPLSADSLVTGLGIASDGWLLPLISFLWGIAAVKTAAFLGQRIRRGIDFPFSAAGGIFFLLAAFLKRLLP